MITFGIITNHNHHKTNQHTRITAILTSIERENIPNYEVVIVGDYKIYSDEPCFQNVKCVSFNDSIRPGWLSKKKNIVTNHANGNIIVYMHDYVILGKNWYQNFKNFGYNWDLCMHQIINKDGTRFRDWCVFQYDGEVIGTNGVWQCKLKKCPPCLLSPYLPDYSYNKTQYMYISGAYWLAKKEVMKKEPFDEEFIWGQHEDIEWSFRVLPKYKYVMNPQCKVHLLHQKDPVWSMA